MNLHDGYRKLVSVQGQQMLLCQEEGSLRLFSRHCPHEGQVLDKATVVQDVLTCPRHHIQFSLSDGKPLRSLCGSLRVYNLVYEGNSVGVDE
ncbi:Rieske 2Fe-2S domain-containing protein [Congregibacter brevis]|uniref:Rieske 2Fe-2S domain-containing protein n=1 Tax=Congregibacter brevis TaxID=3081201 RepID=A0ABZ0ID26_9GAMM|nr:Rieske 2Fe-2S domain-containing protein [Congregibacter sp. IMCC45268]